MRKQRSPLESVHVGTASRRYLSGPQVDRRYGISAMTRYRWRKNPALEFPPPDLEINDRPYWGEDTLDGWDESQRPHGTLAEPCSKGARAEAEA